jgi:hypothetical protein
VVAEGSVAVAAAVVVAAVVAAVEIAAIGGKEKFSSAPAGAPNVI